MGRRSPLVGVGVRGADLRRHGHAARLDAAAITGSHLMGMGRRATAVGDERRLGFLVGEDKRNGSELAAGCVPVNRDVRSRTCTRVVCDHWAGHMGLLRMGYSVYMVYSVLETVGPIRP